MGKIYYVMGKSCSGKDTIYRRLTERHPELHTIIPYTTRPIREGERDGVEYFFVDQERMEEYKKMCYIQSSEYSRKAIHFLSLDTSEESI